MLKQAGFTQTSDGGWERDGKKLEGKLLTSNRSPNEEIATVTPEPAEGHRRAGGDPAARLAAVMKATTEGAFDLLLWRYDWFDPDALNVYLSSAAHPADQPGVLSNKQVDALFQRG